MEKTPLNLFKKKHNLIDGKFQEIPASPLMKRLGYGTGVAVYFLQKNSRKNASSPWAVKKCLKMKANLKDETYSKRLDFEANILKSLVHNNIVGFRSYEVSSDGRFNLCMEAMTTSLGDFLENRYDSKTGALEVDKIYKMGYDISKALNYLHNEVLLMHGDIKSFNILVKGDFIVCKLCDFGVSIPIQKDGLIDFAQNPNALYTGTDCWSAPEVFEEDPALISEKSEIFSFGMVFYECVTCVPPHTLEMMTKKALEFEDEDNETTVNNEEENVEDGDEDDEPIYGVRPFFPHDMNLSKDYDNVLHIFHICTEDNPEDRPSAKKLENIFSELNIIVID